MTGLIANFNIMGLRFPLKSLVFTSTYLNEVK